MNLDNDYIKTRKLAVTLTLLVLVLGSIIYFSTGIALKNNEMMYKDIYGENATLDTPGDAATEVMDINDVKNIKTVLV